MPGYMIFEIEITDSDARAEYRQLAGPVMAAGGGRFLANDSHVVPLEGGWSPASLSIVEFPSVQAARDFYESEAYQRTMPLRQKASRGRGVLIAGIDGEAPGR